MKESEKTVAVVGLGYVGLPLALLADKKGFGVIGIDLDEQKVKLINKRQSPFADEVMVNKLKTARLVATTDFSKVKGVLTVVICVPTPVYKNRSPNYESVKVACRKIAPYLQRGQLVILESSINPGGCEEIVLPILERGSRLIGGKDFFLAHCPERINPGDKKWNVSNIPRVVGGLDKTSLDRATKFYKSVISAEIKPMGCLRETEAVKMVENSFRNVNIAFVNELARSFARLGIDVVNVIEGAATKPFGFMSHYPGCGVGGHCIPVDPHYLINYAKKKSGFNHSFLALACKINEGMPKFTVDLVVKGLQKMGVDIKGTKVAVLGLAYKADVGDCRESPAFEIIRELQKKGIKVVTYDPLVLSSSTAKDLGSALTGVKAVVVATGHREFRERIRPELLLAKKVKLVVDGRNCLAKEKFAGSGVSYIGIGRGVF